jgi:radical SAM superfamily enzyme YgiQ (UPF0313 family)
MKTKIALVICPQWSIETPSFAIGSLKSHINKSNIEIKQFDLNVSSYDYISSTEHHYKFVDWGNDYPWNEEYNVKKNVIPYFEEYWNPIIDELSTFDIVTFTTYTSNITITDYFARYIKQKNPKIQIWYGGPYSWYAECAGLVSKGYNKEFVDVATDSNEGEVVIADLVNNWLENGNYENVKGIWRWDKQSPSFPTVLPKGRSGREPIFNGNIPPLNLNKVKSPSWDKEVLDMYKSVAKKENVYPKLPVQGSRGCTFKCTFCQETRRYRFKDFDNVVDDMKQVVKETGITGFWFTDSLINGSMSKFSKFIERLEYEKNQNDFNVTWGGYFRTHKKMDSNLLKKAVSVGLDYMNVGTENGTNKILALMEKGQTAEDVSFFLKSAYEAKAFFNANWIPGYPKENYMDFMQQLKFLYDNRKYFENNGLVNLMRSTDLLNNTPIEEYRDKFDVSTDNKLINCWISNDKRNFLAVRYLRSNCTEMLLRTMGFTKDIDDTDESTYSVVKDKKFGGTPPYYRARVFADKLNIKKEVSKVRNRVSDEYLSSRFLDYKKSKNLNDILKEELSQTYKAFIWTIFNLYKSSDIEFSSRDKFGGYNLKNSYFNYDIKVKTDENNILSTFKYELFIDKQDKKLNDKTDKFDIHIKDEVVIDLIGKKIVKEKSDVVEGDYLDSKNFYKHKLNLPRTQLTNQY